MREFDGLLVKISQAEGVYSAPGTFGSSGILLRKLSSFSLNSSTEQRDRFLISLGQELKSRPPCTLKDDSLMFLILAVVFFFRGGITHRRPSLSLVETSILHDGTKHSRLFHTYIMR